METHLFWSQKAKGQGHETQRQVCVTFHHHHHQSSGRTQYHRCCIRKQRWVFSAAMSRRTSHANDTGFSLRHISAAGFAIRGVFRSQQATKILPAWVISI